MLYNANLITNFSYFLSLQLFRKPSIHNKEIVMNKSIIFEQSFEGPQPLKIQAESQSRRHKCDLKNILELTQENETNFDVSLALGKQGNCYQQKNSITSSCLQKYLKCMNYLWSLFASKPKMKYSINQKDIQKQINKIKARKHNFPVFLPKKTDQKPVLVLDLDETLLFTTDHKPNKYDHQVQITYGKTKSKIYSIQRFGLSAFLFKMSQIYEIVIFTAGHSDYAHKIITKIDPKKRISHLLCRDHCIVINGSHYLKHIRSLGREMSRIVFVDDNVLSGILQPQNFYKIQAFKGNQKDRKLVQLIGFLKFLHEKNCYTPISQLRKEFQSRQIELFTQTAETQTNSYQNTEMNLAYSILLSEGNSKSLRKNWHNRTNSEIQCIPKQISQKEQDQQTTIDDNIK